VAQEIAAEIRLHGRRVGPLHYALGGSTFTYDDDLTAPDHKTLGQIFEDDPRTIRRARVGIPEWFANLLPEGALRQQIVREMGGGNVGDFTLLLRLGADLPGAVTVHAENEPEDDVTVDQQDADHPVRASLAGIQLKYSVHRDRLTFPASGNGAWWIVKIPDRSLRDLVLNEYLTMRWLHAAGMDVPAVSVAPAKEVVGIPEGVVDPAELVYVVERFDRSASGRVHVEDFAQIADVPPSSKYGEFGTSYDGLAAAILQIVGVAGYEDFIQRLVAMLIVGNTDAHLKNWALIYPDGRTAGLAPVYDFHSLTIYDQYRYTPLALSLNGERAAGHIGLEDIRRLAERCGVDPEQSAAVAAAAARRLRAAWSGDLRDEAESRFPALARHFDRRLETLPICMAA
jgi:serine/threonine-protein kinase HipA